ncbi:MAG: leucine-rich repeat domain-containing protein [Clostridia bacterium]|nr:leucine-rich repeat domain-containing protein [Clostridia bacterium]
MKKIVIFAIFVVMILTGCNAFSDDFEDKQVQIGVDRALRQNGLKNGDYGELRHLDLSFLAIESLEGLEQLTHLESLDISDNVITDITPLKALEDLRILDLQNNLIENLEPLSNLKNLEVLLIRNNPVDSIQGLEPIFGQLKTTDFLTKIAFEDEMFEAYIRELIGKQEDQVSYYDLERIKRIDLRDTEIKDISGIEHAHNLDTLIINQPVKGLGHISGLENLKHLELTNCNIGSLTFITNLKALDYLDLSWNLLSEIQVLKDMNTLTYLDISFNKITDLSPLKSLTQLESLYVNGNYISDYESIESLLSEVKYTDAYIVYFQDNNLDLAIRNQLNKPEGVITKSDLKSIKSLNVSNNGIESLDGIELLENLVELNIGYNNVKDLSPIKTLSQLKILKANNNEIENLSVLKYITELQIIDLKDNLITSIEALTYLNNLEYLLLEGNVIDDLYKETLKEQVKFTDEW